MHYCILIDCFYNYHEGSGFIERSELEGFLHIQGFSPLHAKQIFEITDTNNDGRISIEEFMHTFSKLGFILK